MNEINIALAEKLINKQFPEWTNLPISLVEKGGNDNRTFRLGTEMSIRLPSAERYAPQINKESTWLPFLEQNLKLPISVPIAKGEPSEDFPWNWSVCKWLPGEAASQARVKNMKQFAIDLARFLRELQSIDSTGGPYPGEHNFFRGGPLSVYDEETRLTAEKLRTVFDKSLLLNIWNRSLESQWLKEPVWVHGDIAPGNLLVDETGRLTGVIDFGILGIGDPACDLAIAWTFFDRESREAFKKSLNLDDDTLERGRAWVLWKTMITYDKIRDVDGNLAGELEKVLFGIITDYKEKRFF